MLDQNFRKNLSTQMEVFKPDIFLELAPVNRPFEVVRGKIRTVHPLGCTVPGNKLCVSSTSLACG